MDRQPFRCIGNGSVELLLSRRSLPSTSGVSLWPGDFLSTSDNLRAAARPLSTFHAAGRPSVNFRQLSLRQWDLP